VTGSPLDADDVELPVEVVALLGSSSTVEDALVLTADRVLVVSAEPVRGPNGKRIGTIATIRDHTRLQELAGEIDTVTTLADALRSQTHEFANRLHTIIALIELGRVDDAIAFASSEVDTSQRLAEQLVETVDEPFLTALLLGKSAQANERGIRFELSVTGTVVSALPPRDIVTIVGNLLDNAMDASTRTREPAVHVTVLAGLESLRISVSDSGPGPDPADLHRLFELGVTTKLGGPHGRGIGLALVRQSVRRLGGDLEVEGSEFTVTLPKPRPPMDDPATGSAHADVVRRAADSDSAVREEHP
jgi:two-component system CitB family sensor kinase